MLMKVNRMKVVLLMLEHCNGNYNQFARELGINPSHIYRYLNSGIGEGRKLVGAIIKFCKDRGINYEEYVEL